MHTGTDFTDAALADVIAILGENHEFATISELIYSDSFKIDSAGRQIPFS